ncbi:MAG: hypothetical protein FWB86_12815 [Treponema sp.]|nr:hypothetical protein [Treponema sp.]
MKKITFFFLILIFVIYSVFSDEFFFPTAVGIIKDTANLNSNGRIEGYERMTVIDVRESGGEITVVYTIQLLDRNGRPIRNSSEREYSLIISNGVLIYPVSNIMDPFFAAKNLNYTMTAGNFLIPSTLALGNKIEDTWMKLVVSVPLIGSVTADVTMTDMVCISVENVTVPAGTFMAYKITQTTTTKTTGWGRPLIVNTGETWYVKGIGVVKNITYDSRGRAESSSELHELRR